MNHITVYNTTVLITCGLSGGLVGYIIDDINRVCIKNTRYLPTPFENPMLLVNTGFFVGLGLGFSFVITGKPLVDNLLY